MDDTNQDRIETLKALRLPELWARYAELHGTRSACPNKKWLARAIAAKEAEAAEEQAAAGGG